MGGGGWATPATRFAISLDPLYGCRTATRRRHRLRWGSAADAARSAMPLAHALAEVACGFSLCSRFRVVPWGDGMVGAWRYRRRSKSL
eukprot:7375851-Prymnesium_polylepis.1